MKNDSLSSRYILACFLFLVLAALSPARGVAGEEGAKKLRIVATLFPQYDFARRIGGDRVEATLLLPAGADAHSFDPKPSDLIGIARADMFAYTGADMEPWAEELIEALGDAGSTRIVDVSEGIEFIKSAEAEHAEEEHEGEKEHGEEAHEAEHDDHDHDHGRDHGEHVHVHLMDPHVWLDPVLAMTMVDNLRKALNEADPAGAALYNANAAALTDELMTIDADCRRMASEAKRKTLVFGGKFAFAYFTKRYGLDHVGAYDSCGAGEEPSVKRIIEVTEYVKDNHIPVIFHEEFVEPKISQTIAASTGCSVAMVHSLHNLSAAERAADPSYVELMRRNIGTLAGGLR